MIFIVSCWRSGTNQKAVLNPNPPCTIPSSGLSSALGNRGRCYQGALCESLWIHHFCSHYFITLGLETEACAYNLQNTWNTSWSSNVILLLTLCFLKTLWEGRKCTCNMRWLEGISCFPLPISGHLRACVTLWLNESPEGVVLKAGFFVRPTERWPLEESVMSEDVVSKSVRRSMLSMEQWMDFSWIWWFFVQL